MKNKFAQLLLLLFGSYAPAQSLITCHPRPNATGDIYGVEIKEIGTKLQYIFSQKSESRSTILKQKTVTLGTMKQSGFCRISVYPESTESYPNPFLYIDKDRDQKEWTLRGPGDTKVPDLICNVRASYQIDKCEKAQDMPIIPIRPQESGASP